ncbi:hypothetical protein D3C76_789450 [compost metagenome]
MITRAQAEALLTLAESLEACERLGIRVTDTEDEGTAIYYGDIRFYIPSVDPVSIRLAVNALIQKQET